MLSPFWLSLPGHLRQPNEPFFWLKFFWKLCYNVSDHLPTFANFIFYPKGAKKYKLKLRCLKNFDLPSFLEDLNTALFDLDFHNQNNSDINITCNNFILMFNNILDQHAPLRFASKKETRSFHKTWLTKGLLTSISKKNALYNKMSATNNPSNSTKCKFYRNKITHPRESLKQNHYRSKFEKCRSDFKKTWKVINEIISTKTKNAK